MNVLDTLKKAQDVFKTMLEDTRSTGGLTKDRYARYLSMQFHLTKGVQRPFLTVASHADLGTRRELRSFLVNFANEEEFHYEIARKDLKNLGVEPVAMPLDVELWWSYFDRIVTERPFVRLGATIILENLAGGCREVIDELFAKADYLTPQNTLFFRIHKHEELPHGDQILEALNNPRAKLEPRHWKDLEEGAAKGAVLYLRMAEWALKGDAVYKGLLTAA